jgi:hypothetical protein
MIPALRTETLTYAVTPRLNLRRLTIRSLATIALTVSCAWLLTKAYGWHYYAEANRVQVVLEAATPNGRVKLGGFDDSPLEWELVEALVSVDGSREKTLLLHGPRAADLRNGKVVHLSAVGKYHFTFVTPENYWLTGVDFGNGGRFSQLFQFKSVQNLVHRYDEVVAFIQSLPPTGHFPGNDGKRYSYEIKDHSNAPGQRVIIVRDPLAPK